ncbi:hypothetical protein WUBG_16538 [Wuchereria bancrofti]|uniref:Uncharacterized protein n=1 Tax=Wuchereria bancrofti TaxID=6293 RepID=J9DSJ7_WUCBA|nr:hypothetical protein WUBG_16538 [Wuchereria bancrofti]
MPLFEGCCSNSLIDRKKSTAYIPSSHQLGEKQQQQQQQQQQEQQQQQQQQQEENNCQPISPSTSVPMVKAI